MLSFSPPRVPKHSPSYLIWSIFTKEREEKKRQQALQQQHQDHQNRGRGPKNGVESETSKKRRAKSADRDSPMSRVPALWKASSDHDFESTLLNAKLAELEKEIDTFKKENANLVAGEKVCNVSIKKAIKPP